MCVCVCVCERERERERERELAEDNCTQQPKELTEITIVCTQRLCHC